MNNELFRILNGLGTSAASKLRTVNATEGIWSLEVEADLKGISGQCLSNLYNACKANNVSFEITPTIDGEAICFTFFEK